MPHQIYSTEIRKTGFVLENQVAQLLKAAGWTVISNKYYVDDSEETVREIDLVAYRVNKVQHLDVYTVLIVSCKKSDSNAWALLARDINLKDPNSDWWPLHAWSNDKALQFQLLASGKAKQFHEAAQRNGVQDALSVPEVEVFAFQEMDKKSGKPQNDKPIFGAITSLMKAQAYELAALPARKKVPSIYQFNLLSVVDADLIRLMFRGTDITSSPLSAEHYLARYIVRKREVFSRVRFICASAFESCLEDYGRLHQSNCRWFGTQCDEFYSRIFEDRRRTDALLEDFKSMITWSVEWRLERKFGRKVEIGSPALVWVENESRLCVGFELSGDELEFMNESEDIRRKVSDSLKAIYRYEGPYKFEFDIVF